MASFMSTSITLSAGEISLGRSYDGELLAEVINKIGRASFTADICDGFDETIDEDGAALLRALVARLPQESGR